MKRDLLKSENPTEEFRDWCSKKGNPIDNRRCLISDTSILFDPDKKQVGIRTVTDTRLLTTHGTITSIPEEVNIGEDGMQIVEESHGGEVYNETRLDFRSEKSR